MFAADANRSSPQHHVASENRKQMDAHIKIPDHIYALMQRLNSAGYDCYVVGGYVRDLLLDRPTHDIDLATSATPEEIMEVFTGYKVIPTGIEHGTVTVLANGDAVEVTTFRKDSDYSDHRHPDLVFFTTSIEDDLSRRDFTINALAWHPGSGLIDVWGGLSDLANCVIRAVGESDKRFREDALRILRALRFSSELCFSIEDATKKALMEQRQLLSHVAMERFRIEFDRLLRGDGVASVLTDYVAVPGVVIPELLSLQAHMNGAQSLLDIAVKRVDAVRPNSPLRLAALLYDVDLLSFPEDDREPGHQASAIARRLRYSKAEVNKMEILVASQAYELIPEIGSVWRALKQWGEATFQEVLEIRLADKSARDPDNVDASNELSEIQAIAESLIREGRNLSLADLAIDGNDLISLGCRGEMIGTVLDELLERVCVDGLANRRDVLLYASGVSACERPVSDLPRQ